MKKINLIDKFSLFSDHWSPKIIAEMNDQFVKIAKVKGEFVWHDHAKEDELFFVVKGTLYIDLKNEETIVLNEGNMTVIPSRTEHRPYTKNNEEVWIMLLEPKSTQHTGQVAHNLTNNTTEYI